MGPGGSTLQTRQARDRPGTPQQATVGSRAGAGSGRMPRLATTSCAHKRMLHCLATRLPHSQWASFSGGLRLGPESHDPSRVPSAPPAIRAEGCGSRGVGQPCPMETLRAPGPPEQRL